MWEVFDLFLTGTSETSESSSSAIFFKPRRRIQSLLLSPKSIKPETHRQCKRNSKAERDDNRRAALDPLLHLPDQHQNRVYRLGYRNWDIVKPRKPHHCSGFYLLLARSPVLIRNPRSMRSLRNGARVILNFWEIERRSSRGGVCDLIYARGVTHYTFGPVIEAHYVFIQIEWLYNRIKFYSNLI